MLLAWLDDRALISHALRPRNQRDCTTQRKFSEVCLLVPGASEAGAINSLDITVFALSEQGPPGLLDARAGGGVLALRGSVVENFRLIEWSPHSRPKSRPNWIGQNIHICIAFVSPPLHGALVVWTARSDDDVGASENERGEWKVHSRSSRGICGRQDRGRRARLRVESSELVLSGPAPSHDAGAAAHLRLHEAAAVAREHVGLSARATFWL